MAALPWRLNSRVPKCWILLAFLGIGSWSFSSHFSQWQRHADLAGRAEDVLDLGGGRHLKILRDLLSSSEAAELLALAHGTPWSPGTGLAGNPVETPCHVVKDDRHWNPGVLAHFLRPIIEERLLPYMRRALGCSTLEVSQTLLRHYPATGAPRTFPKHSDHMAYGTAVLDLTPVSGSGLFVDCGGGAFFVPLSCGDVAVHAWNVVHGVHLKDDHERISLIVWTAPADDLRSGLCSWYLKKALEEDLQAAHHLGVEAWRQRLLGIAQLKVLHETLKEEAATADSGELAALGGAGQAQHWQKRCADVARRVKDMTDEAMALKTGEAMKDLGRGLASRQLHSSSGAKNAVRRALQRGWEHAQRERRRWPLGHDVGISTSSRVDAG